MTAPLIVRSAEALIRLRRKFLIIEIREVFIPRQHGVIVDPKAEQALRLARDSTGPCKTSRQLPRGRLRKRPESQEYASCNSPSRR